MIRSKDFRNSRPTYIDSPIYTTQIWKESFSFCHLLKQKYIYVCGVGWQGNPYNLLTFYSHQYLYLREGKQQNKRNIKKGQSSSSHTTSFRFYKSR